MNPKMRIAYIAHPIGGDVENNLASLRQVIKRINHEEPLTVPFCPYYADVVSLGDDDPNNRARGLRNDLALLSKPGVVDELRLYGACISKGMREEVLVAIHMEMPIICASQELHNQLVAIMVEVKATSYLYLTI